MKRYYSEITQTECRKGDACAIEIPENHDFLNQVPAGFYMDYPATGLPVLTPIDADVKTALDFIDAELANSIIETQKHIDGDAGAIATFQDWLNFEADLAAYVVDYAIVTAQPTRPT